uniref:Pectate lyase n=1 Tax=viral metagenome TaxID=1070528 RepID=A0A6M3KEY2_9ZZZZ
MKMKKIFIAMLLVVAFCGISYSESSLTSPVTIDGVPITGSIPGNLITGKVFYVGSSGVDSGASGKDVSTPFATAEYATNSTTGSRGDVVYFLYGYTENITSATTWTADKANVHYFGLGSGSNRPTFTFTTATSAVINVTADNVTFENIVFDLTGVDDLVKGVYVTGANVRFINCKFIQADDNAGSGTGSAAQRAVVVGHAGDYNIFDGVKFIGPTASGEEAYSNTSVSAIDYSLTTGTGSHYEQTVKNCEFIGMWSTAAVNSDYTMTRFITAGNTGKNYSPGCRLFDMSGGNNTYFTPDMGEKTIELYAMPTPNAATTTVFTFAGLLSDSIDVLSVSGAVSEAIQATATTISLVADPTPGLLSNTFIAAAADITGDLAGSILSVGDMGGTLAESVSFATALTFTDGQQFMLTPCAIALWSVNTSTGAITWRMRYRTNSTSVFVY